MPMPLAVGYKAHAHQLISLKPLLTTQATHRLLIGIVLVMWVGNTTACFHGWFHTFLIELACEGASPYELGNRVYHAVDQPVQHQSYQEESGGFDSGITENA